MSATVFEGKTSQGGTLQYWDEGTSQYKNICMFTSIPWLESTHIQTDVTTLCDTATKTKSVLFDNPEFTAEGFFDPEYEGSLILLTNHLDLNAADLRIRIKIGNTNRSINTFVKVTGYSGVNSVGENVTATVTLKPNQPIKFYEFVDDSADGTLLDEQTIS